MIDWENLPNDLTMDEMLEIIESLRAGTSDDLQTEFWLKCLKSATGVNNVSDIIYFPEQAIYGYRQDHVYSSTDILNILMGRQSRDRHC